MSDSSLMSNSEAASRTKVRIVCHACGARFLVCDERVRGKRFRATCKRCGGSIVAQCNEDFFVVTEEEMTPPVGTDDLLVEGEELGWEGQISWYVEIGGKTYGPISGQDVIDAYFAGKVDDQTYCWREGWVDWQMLRDAPEFQQELAAAEQTPVYGTPWWAEGSGQQKEDPDPDSWDLAVEIKERAQQENGHVESSQRIEKQGRNSQIKRHRLFAIAGAAGAVIVAVIFLLVNVGSEDKKENSSVEKTLKQKIPITITYSEEISSSKEDKEIQNIKDAAVDDSQIVNLDNKRALKIKTATVTKTRLKKRNKNTFQRGKQRKSTRKISEADAILEAGKKND